MGNTPLCRPLLIYSFSPRTGEQEEYEPQLEGAAPASTKVVGRYPLRMVKGRRGRTGRHTLTSSLTGYHRVTVRGATGYRLHQQFRQSLS